ncbi:MAG: hypothetical protein ACRDNF_11030 [Streptosporangiaceae bacterium]
MSILEGVRNQVDLVTPMAVDSGLARMSACRDRLDGEGTVADLGKLIERSLADDGPGTLDAGINSRSR